MPAPRPRGQREGGSPGPAACGEAEEAAEGAASPRGRAGLWARLRRGPRAWSPPGARPEQMAESDPGDRNYDNMLKMLSDLNKDLEKLLEEMEKISVQATWMAYDMVVMRTNPALADSMRRLEDAFLNCKEEMEKNWQELLNETKPKQ
ncbi:synaptonemal complex central element protein 3 isoform 1-T1 [Sarcophilus harrisii]